MLLNTNTSIVFVVADCNESLVGGVNGFGNTLVGETSFVAKRVGVPLKRILIATARENRAEVIPCSYE